MDTTFKVLKQDDPRSDSYQGYREEWDYRGDKLDSGTAPIHVDIETVATCDLKCGSNLANPEGFCQIWTHEHLRKEGFSDKTYKPGFIDPSDFHKVIERCDSAGVQSVKLNYRGEPSLHPYISEFVHQAAFRGFKDISMNTNGNGGARKDPELFAKLVKNGIINLMFSADACTPEIYVKQRVNGDWQTLLNSVRSAIVTRDMGLGNEDCRIRVSAVRTSLNATQIDSGQFEEFWVDKIGVDWVSISECYFPAGASHSWRAMEWEDMTRDDAFACADPFRRMVITWNLQNVLPCCQGFTKEIDAGPFTTVETVWNSKYFNTLRMAHTMNLWDMVPMCKACPLTKKPVRMDV
jgi:hypothetical protein